MKAPKRKTRPLPASARDPWLYQIWRNRRIQPTKGKEAKLPYVLTHAGKGHAKLCIVAPPMTLEEYSRQKLFSSPEAMIFRRMCEVILEIDLNEDALILPSCLWGFKPNKNSGEGAREIFEKVAQTGKFNIFASIGDQAFAHIFGRGKKPAMPSIAGQTMFVPETRFKPLFVFPDLQGLVVDEDSKKFSPYEIRRAIDWQDKVVKRFERLLKDFKKLLNKKP